jgi:septum site-determining protein MinC
VPEIFATETMAELCVRQGRASEAMSIYRALLDRLGGAVEAQKGDADSRRARWVARLSELGGQTPRVAAPAAASLDTADREGSVEPSGEPAGSPAAGSAGERSAGDRTLRALETMAAQIDAELGAPGANRPPGHAGPQPPERAPSDVRPPAPALSAPTPSTTASAGFRLPVLVQQTVRSGQVVYAEGTDLIVLGAVNAGAQLMADGNIHVYGPLRGRAIAGVKGARDARIFCQRLEAELVGIDASFLTAEALPVDLVGKAVQVLLERGQCVVLRM